MRVVTAECLCAAVLVVAGCGTSDVAQIRKAVRALALGVVSGDGEKACANISPAHRERVLEIFGRALGDRTCAAFVKALRRDDTPAQRRRAQRLPVKSISIRGDRATARVSITSDAPKTVQLVREGDRWLYDGFAPEGVQRSRRPVTCPAHLSRRLAHRETFDARRLLGMPVGPAAKLAHRFGCTVRVTAQDGYMPFALTADLRLDRVELVTESDVIVRVGIG